MKQVIRQEDEVSGFDLTTRSYNNNDDMSTATAVAPYITSEGLLDCGVDCNMHHPLPSGTQWEIHINCEITGDAAITYNNNVDGGVSFRNSNGGFKIYNTESTYNQASRLGDFTDTNNTTNTLSIIRDENNITFSYTDVNGNLVSYTRTYTSLSINGTFYLRIANGSLIVHSLTMIEEGGGAMSNMIDLPTYNEENWNIKSRGTGSTQTTFTDEGICTLGLYNYHTYNQQPLNLQKQYNIYFYQNGTAGNIAIGTVTDTEHNNRYGKTSSQANGGITGMNKAVLTYENGVWYISYNNNTKLLLTSRKETQYLNITTTTSSYNPVLKLLAITEEDAD